MKAILAKAYGPPEQLTLEDIPKPTPKPAEVCIKVIATAINDFDWSMVTGKPAAYRLLFGLAKPKQPIPGIEIAGIVEAVGDKASTFSVGDAVYGDLSADSTGGGLAEYCCAPEKALVKKPENMSFEEAAALSHAAMLASQALIDLGHIQEGEQVLINGAGGGVGTLGLQMAKTYGAEVTGVDTGQKLEMMQRLGFDHVIDYKKQDFTRNGKQYDLIIDAKTTRSPHAYLRSLPPGGRYVTVGGKLSRLLQLVLLKGWISRRHQRQMHILSLKQNKDLDYIHGLYSTSQLKPVIDGPYTLQETPWAIRYFGDGKHQGKVVIRVGEE